MRPAHTFAVLGLLGMMSELETIGEGEKEGGLNWPLLLIQTQSPKCLEFLADVLDFYYHCPRGNMVSRSLKMEKPHLDSNFCRHMRKKPGCLEG